MVLIQLHDTQFVRMALEQVKYEMKYKWKGCWSDVIVQKVMEWRMLSGVRVGTDLTRQTTN
jgi:hypothetical protein